MIWGTVELEAEIRDWYLGLSQDQQGRVDFHIDRLSSKGPLLDQPHTKQLSGKLRELRFYLAGTPIRLTYWIAPGRRIILLTVFSKTKRNERHEVERARRAMMRCISEEHRIEDNE